MFGGDLRTWILSLDPVRGVTLARGLLLAEASRLNIDLGSVRMTGNIYEPDGGVDGHTSFPPGTDTWFPVGLQTWQVKTGSLSPADVATELAKPRVRQDILDGRNYVLVWTRDPADRTSVEDAVSTGVGAIRPSAVGLLLGLEDVERLATVHPAVVQAQGGPQVMGLDLRSFRATLETHVYPFSSSPSRDQLITELRQLAATPTSLHLHLFGDTGVGKSRAILQALDIDGVRERVVVCASPDSVDTHVLEGMVRSEGTTAIIFVDDVSLEEAERFGRVTRAASGRLVLITAGDRPTRDALADSSTLEVPPLEQPAMQDLIGNVPGIQKEQTDYVAQLSEGYPLLATELAKSIVATQQAGSVVELLRGVTISRLLQEMLPDATVRRHVAYLSLCHRVGFEGGLEYETSQLCAAFKIDEAAFRQSIETELGRFVTSIGRYRRSTPKALAIWLVRELALEDSNSLVEGLDALPAPLFESFREQVQLLGGDRRIEEVIEEVLARRGDTFRSIQAFTDEGARLLHAAAFATPEAVADIYQGLLAPGDIESLRAVADGRRRESVWALAHLLWFESTFARAADSLLALAVAENETFGNNATGTISGVFNVYLGGTEVPYLDRVAWLASAYSRFDDAGAKVALTCLSQGLSRWESRIGGWEGSRLQPTEWHPSDSSVEKAARLAALQLFMQVVDLHPTLEMQAATELAQSFRALAERGLGLEALSEIQHRHWGERARASLLEGLRGALYYDSDDLSSGLAESIHLSIEQLEGNELSDRLRVTLSSPYWDLTVGIDEKLEGPEILRILAKQLLDDPDRDRLAAALALDETLDQSTTQAFFEQMGRLDDSDALEWVTQDRRCSLAAAIGYAVGRVRDKGDEWIDVLLAQWSHDPHFAPGISWVAHRVPATAGRVALLTQVVGEGRAPLDSLNHLMLGGWVNALSEEDLMNILSLYLAVGELPHHQADASLHMLLFWIDSRTDELSDTVVPTALELLENTRRFHDLSWTRDSIQQKLPIPDDQQLELLFNSLAVDDFPTAQQVELLQRLAERDPFHVIDQLISRLSEDTTGWTMWVQRAHLISAIATVCDPVEVATRIHSLSNDVQSRLLHHLDFIGPGVDPVWAQMLAMGAEPAIQEEAVSRYIYPGEIVVGSYSAYLKRRREQLVSWKTSGPKWLAHWADQVLPILDKMIISEAATEAEQRY